MTKFLPISDDTRQEIIENLVKKLKKNPYHLHFYSLLNQLELLGLLSDEYLFNHQELYQIRLGQEASLAFATSDIDSIKQENQFLYISINGYGLIGVNAPMPLSFTEYIFERKYQYGDTTWLSFINLLQHRLILGFYRAWRQSQSVKSLNQDDTNNFTKYIASLLGISHIEFKKENDVIDYYAKIYYAGFYLGQRRSAKNLAQLLTQYFKVPIHIEENIGQWIVIDETEKTKLGGQQFSLGEGLLCGDRVFDVRNKFRIIIGALDLSDYYSFFKKADNTKKMVEWIHHILGYEFNWDMRLVLKQEEIPKFHLGKKIQLGLTSWLGKVHQDANDLTIQLNT